MKSQPTIIAFGADVKNQALAADGDKISYGPVLGDLSDPVHYRRLQNFIMRSLRTQKKGNTTILACDLHPGYFSTRLAQEIASSRAGTFLRPVQHHHAHIASILWEQGWTRPALGVSFDGTGYGTDGNIWGGEFLLVEGASFKRLAHLDYLKMPGGEKTVREPWRLALSMVGARALGVLKVPRESEQKMVLEMLEKDVNCPLSSSVGRVLDAAAALLGAGEVSVREAQGPRALEALCREGIEESYDFAFHKNGHGYVVDVRPAFAQLLRDLRKKTDRAAMATRFHNTVVDLTEKMVRTLNKSTGLREVALSGGVFQNRYLTQKISAKLRRGGFQVLMNDKLPAHDLNIAIGQYHVSRRPG